MTCAQGLLRLLWGGGRSWSATVLINIVVGNFRFVICNIFVLIRLLVARSRCRDSCACMHRSCSGCNTIKIEKSLRRILGSSTSNLTAVSSRNWAQPGECQHLQKVVQCVNTTPVP